MLNLDLDCMKTPPASKFELTRFRSGVWSCELEGRCLQNYYGYFYIYICIQMFLKVAMS